MHRNLPEEKSTVHFTSLDDKPIADPRPDIHRLTHTDEDRPLARVKDENKIDYQAYDPTTHIAVTELWGKRDSQEDRLAFGQIPEFAALNKTEREAVLKQTVKQLEDEIEEGKLDNGSTLCITVICGNTVYNANVGDSESYLVVKNKENQIVRFERINTVIHHLTDENLVELGKRMRLRNCGDGNIRMLDNYGAAALNLYRSMGDTVCNASGLEHHPDIYTLDAPDDSAIISACDGLTERITFATLEQFVRDNAPLPLKALAKALAEYAIKTGSTDNISIMTTPIDPQAPAKYLAVFDGHGGTTVSNLLEQRFPVVFQQQIRAMLLMRVPSTFRPAVSGMLTEADGLIARLDKQHPHAGIAALYQQIQTRFSIKLGEQKEPAAQSLLLNAHAGRMLTLTTLLRDALLLSNRLNLNAPSSFSPEYEHWDNDKTIKKHINIVESNALTALTAFRDVPDKDAEQHILQITTPLQASIKEARLHVQQTIHRPILEEKLPALLKGRYTEILAEAKTLNEKMSNPNFEAPQAVDQLLFQLYLNVYKTSRVKKLFSNSRLSVDFAPQLEAWLTTRFPDIEKTAPHHGIKNTLENRMLAYAGNHYPELVKKTRKEILAIVKLENAPENKKAFKNHMKMLMRLGDEGFKATSMIVKHTQGEYVSESEIGDYYDGYKKAEVRASKKPK